MSDDQDFENKVKLVINGNDIELNKFTDDIIKETILGLLKAIKTSEYGVDEVKNVEISIDNVSVFSSNTPPCLCAQLLSCI